MNNIAKRNIEIMNCICENKKELTFPNSNSTENHLLDLINSTELNDIISMQNANKLINESYSLHYDKKKKLLYKTIPFDPTFYHLDNNELMKAIIAYYPDVDCFSSANLHFGYNHSKNIKLSSLNKIESKIIKSIIHAKNEETMYTFGLRFEGYVNMNIIIFTDDISHLFDSLYYELIKIPGISKANDYMSSILTPTVTLTIIDVNEDIWKCYIAKSSEDLDKIDQLCNDN